MSIVKRVEPLSAMRVAGILYAALGLVVGAMFSLIFATMGSFPMKDGQTALPFPLRILFSGLAVVIFPVLYGVIGALMAGLMTALYNLVAKWVGGIEVEVG
jgi:Transmembrane domain of unknown function (DUF3566)